MPADASLEGADPVLDDARSDAGPATPDVAGGCHAGAEQMKAAMAGFGCSF